MGALEEEETGVTMAKEERSAMAKVVEAVGMGSSPLGRLISVMGIQVMKVTVAG